MRHLLTPKALLWTGIYILSIFLVNYAFTVLPLIQVGGEAQIILGTTHHLWTSFPFGLFAFPVASLVVGFIFVIRDFTQREIGHWVIPAMLVGGALSYVLADPTIAIASIVAFLLSEFVDWGFFTFTGKTFSSRILLSSTFGAPVDSVLFLTLAGFFSWPAVVAMTLSKMIGAVIVSYIMREKVLVVTNEVRTGLTPEQKEKVAKANKAAIKVT